MTARTYTAAEVKVLTETASKVAYALGRKDAAMEIRLQLAALPTHDQDGEPIIARDVRHAASMTARDIAYPEPPVDFEAEQRKAADMIEPTAPRWVKRDPTP